MLVSQPEGLNTPVITLRRRDNSSAIIIHVNCSRNMEYVHISAIGYAPFFSQQIQLYRSHEHLHCRKLVISWTGKCIYIYLLCPWDFSAVPVIQHFTYKLIWTCTTKLWKEKCNNCKNFSPNVVQNPVQYNWATRRMRDLLQQEKTKVIILLTWYACEKSRIKFGLFSGIIIIMSVIPQEMTVPFLHRLYMQFCLPYYSQH